MDATNVEWLVEWAAGSTAAPAGWERKECQRLEHRDLICRQERLEEVANNSSRHDIAAYHTQNTTNDGDDDDDDDDDDIYVNSQPPNQHPASPPPPPSLPASPPPWVLYSPPLIPPRSRQILSGMVGMVGIWSECHFSESLHKFYSDSNPIPTKFPPNSHHSGQNHLDPCGSNSYQDPSRFQSEFEQTCLFN